MGRINVKGWGQGKYKDMCRELDEGGFDVAGLTETQLRDDVRMDDGAYVMIEKVRKKQERHSFPQKR